MGPCGIRWHVRCRAHGAQRRTAAAAAPSPGAQPQSAAPSAQGARASQGAQAQPPDVLQGCAQSCVFPAEIERIVK